MSKYFIVVIAVLALIALSVPASAETVFNEASKCIMDWGKGCKPCSKSAPAQPAATKPACMTDSLGNKVPCCTDNSGKTKLGT
ncbi:MAG: hypothetical protein WCY36_00460 [Candidatus Omnitrophota bacterium]